MLPFRRIAQAAIMALLPSIVSAQPQGGPLTFEVASVKPSNPGSPGPTMRIDPGGRFTAEGITLRNLITLAWRLSDDDLSGAPSWIESARYDIEAKPSGISAGPGSKEARDLEMLRLQALLLDRFELRFHWKTEPRTMLALVVAKSGPRFEPATGAGASCRQAPDGPGLIVNMEMFARDLSNRMGQRVLDQTGLKGFFCIRLRWTSDGGLPQAMGVKPGEGSPVPASIYSALQSQLGLRLEAHKSSIQVFVMDHIARPRPN